MLKPILTGCHFTCLLLHTFWDFKTRAHQYLAQGQYHITESTNKIRPGFSIDRSRIFTFFKQSYRDFENITVKGAMKCCCFLHNPIIQATLHIFQVFYILDRNYRCQNKGNNRSTRCLRVWFVNKGSLL